MAHKALIRVLRTNLRQCLRLRQTVEARDLLRQLEDEDPLSVETRGMELELLMAEQRWQEAEGLALQLTRLYPSSARIHSLAARIHYRRKSYARAAEHFTEAERLHPHWRSRWWLGKTHTQRGDFDAAEALLVDVVREHPEAGIDVAWLYERRGEPEQALRQVEAYLTFRPDDPLARAQQLRLRATAAAPEDLVDEVETLQELGEEVAPEMLPAYIRRLIETGRGAEARRFVGQRLPQWAPRVAGRVAWECHRLQAYDLAFNLFVAGLPAHHRDFKYLSALESAARHCQRSAEVVAAYRSLVGSNPNLHGRIKVIERKGRS